MKSEGYRYAVADDEHEEWLTSEDCKRGMRELISPSPAYLVWGSKDVEKEEIDFIELDAFLEDSDDDDGSFELDDIQAEENNNGGHRTLPIATKDIGQYQGTTTLIKGETVPTGYGYLVLSNVRTKQGNLVRRKHYSLLQGDWRVTEVTPTHYQLEVYG